MIPTCLIHSSHLKKGHDYLRDQKGYAAQRYRKTTDFRADDPVSVVMNLTSLFLPKLRD